MKAIDTLFDGHLFRSRLEARWAVFFKTLGVEYEYEKEGYDLGGEWYLPDFWLPVQRYWVEIKGQEPTEEEHKKCWALARHVDNERVFLFSGDIPMPEKGDRAAYYYGWHPNADSLVEAEFKKNRGRAIVREDSFDKREFGWVECPFCGRFYISRWGSIQPIPRSNCFCEYTYLRMDSICSIVGDKVCERNPYGISEFLDPYFSKKYRDFLSYYDTPSLVAAYTAARQARFEKGR